MKRLVQALVPAAFLLIATNAFADHDDQALLISTDALALADASTELSDAAELEGYNAFSRTASDVATATLTLRTAVLEGEGLSLPDHDEPLSLDKHFQLVETRFWSLARQWNADAAEFSQITSIKKPYNQVVERYRRLLYSFYDLD